MLVLLAAILLGQRPNPTRYAAFGAETIERLEHDLYNPATSSYKENGSTENGAPSLPASLSSLTELISAFTAAAAYDEKYVPLLRKAVSLVESYWDPTAPMGGYASSISPKGGRSYAENALLATALGQAAAVLKSSIASTGASNALSFAISGLLKSGGVMDHEGDPPYQTAFAGAAFTLAILSQSNNSASDRAVNSYEWVRQNLRDPATNLFRASKNSADLHARDAALMIDSACFLFTATHQTKYGEQSRNLEAETLTQWGTLDGKIKASTPDAEALVEAWLLRIRLCPRPREGFGASVQAFADLEWFHRNARDRDGHYGDSWEMPTNGRLSAWRLVDQAAAVKAYFVAASDAKLMAQE